MDSREHPELRLKRSEAKIYLAQGCAAALGEKEPIREPRRALAHPERQGQGLVTQSVGSVRNQRPGSSELRVAELLSSVIGVQPGQQQRVEAKPHNSRIKGPNGFTT